MIKKIVPLAVIIVGITLVAFSFLPVKQQENITSSAKPDTPLNLRGDGDLATTTANQKIIEENPLPQTKPSVSDSEKIIAPEAKTISISIAVRQATSTLQIPVGSSVYDAMKIFASTTAFRFHSTYYSGMGYFIDEINGEKNRNNAFWVYYVNGAQANVGAGAYILKNGDTIVWRLEDSAKKEVGIK